MEHHAGELFPRVGFIVTNLTQPAGRARLQQVWNLGALDQGRQASSKDDAADLPSLPVKRSGAVAEHDLLQSGEPAAASGAAEENRHVVADQPTAAADEDGRAAGETCPILLAAVGG